MIKRTNTLRKHNNPKYVHTKQRIKACEEKLTEVEKSHSYTRAGLTTHPQTGRTQLTAGKDTRTQ